MSKHISFLFLVGFTAASALSIPSDLLVNQLEPPEPEQVNPPSPTLVVCHLLEPESCTHTQQQVEELHIPVQVQVRVVDMRSVGRHRVVEKVVARRMVGKRFEGLRRLVQEL